MAQDKGLAFIGMYGYDRAVQRKAIYLTPLCTLKIHTATRPVFLFVPDKLLQKDVSKQKITADEAQQTRDRIKAVKDLSYLGDADLVIEVWSQAHFR